jgi:peptidoglycan/LPS O-acetylase OafA/YrhL
MNQFSFPQDNKSLPPANSNIRLHYLDGVRGLAAFYVVLHHAYLQVAWQHQTTLLSLVKFLTKWLEYGSFSVVIFIVLSGYCLTLPVVKTKYLKGGFFRYIKRRAIRIMPPYYAALILTLLLPIFLPILSKYSDTIWSNTGEFSLAALISHFFLFHNLHPSWAYKIDYPMWSIPIEWQIYFLFPLILLPIWRRWGLRATVLSALILGFSPHLIPGHVLDYLKPWYFSMFTLGMAGAIVGFSQQPKLITFRKQMPWGKLSIVVGAILAAIAIPQTRNWLYTHEVITDPLVGFLTTCLLIYCTLHASDRAPKTWNPFLKLVSHPWLVKLGTFSYSLYLIHAPILAAIDLYLESIQVSSVWRLAIVMFVSVPFSIAISYLFHLLFEKRFIPGLNTLKVTGK